MSQRRGGRIIRKTWLRIIVATLIVLTLFPLFGCDSKDNGISDIVLDKARKFSLDMNNDCDRINLAYYCTQNIYSYHFRETVYTSEDGGLNYQIYSESEGQRSPFYKDYEKTTYADGSWRETIYIALSPGASLMDFYVRTSDEPDWKVSNAIVDFAFLTVIPSQGACEWERLHDEVINGVECYHYRRALESPEREVTRNNYYERWISHNQLEICRDVAFAYPIGQEATATISGAEWIIGRKLVTEYYSFDDPIEIEAPISIKLN